jgi:hypothetical protein
MQKLNNINLLLLSVFLYFTPGTFTFVSGQHFLKIEQVEDTLANVLASINLANDDHTKDVLNRKFYNMLFDALHQSASDNYPFKSLKSLAMIKSPDNTFRIIHWNLPTNEGDNRYFGFLKLLNHDPPVIYPLIDKSDSMPDPDSALLNNMFWFGALYYKVIPGETVTGEKIYTLLGWAGKNDVITQKVVEILTFDHQELPHFGLRIFPDFKNGKMTRIIFRYGATTTMSLKFEKHEMAVNKIWNAKKKGFDTCVIDAPMIVCDHMIPLDPELTGQFQYYVAAGDIFDSFVFKNNIWSFFSGIELRSKK